MNDHWKEYARLVVIGGITIVVVFIATNFLVLPKKGASPAPSQQGSVQAPASEDATEYPVKPRAISPNQATPSSMPASIGSSESAVTPPTFVHDSLEQGGLYVASQQYDQATQARVFSNLLTSYMAPSVSPETRRSVLLELQQVDEIEVGHVLREADDLPAKQASQSIKEYLALAQERQLTNDQKTRLKLALAKYSQRPHDSGHTDPLMQPTDTTIPRETKRPPK